MLPSGLQNHFKGMVPQKLQTIYHQVLGRLTLFANLFLRAKKELRGADIFRSVFVFQKKELEPADRVCIFGNSVSPEFVAVLVEHLRGDFTFFLEAVRPLGDEVNALAREVV